MKQERKPEEIPEEKEEIKKVEEKPVKKDPVSPPPPPSMKKAEPFVTTVKAEGSNFCENHLTAVQLANLKVRNFCLELLITEDFLFVMRVLNSMLHLFCIKSCQYTIANTIFFHEPLSYFLRFLNL